MWEFEVQSYLLEKLKILAKVSVYTDDVHADYLKFICGPKVENHCTMGGSPGELSEELVT